MTRLSKSKPRPRTGAAEGESPRRSQRARLPANRSRDAPPPPSTRPRRYERKEEGSVDDLEAEFAGTDVINMTSEEVLPLYRRLYKKRANMALLFYHENNLGDHYEFMNLRLNDVYDFIDGTVPYLHMNFKAKNTTTGSEKLFFAELVLKGDASNKRDGGYHTTACSIVDDNCVGGQKEMLYVKDDLSPGGYDENNCYVCAEKIKHPIGNNYKGGHCTRDYWVSDSSVE